MTFENLTRLARNAGVMPDMEILYIDIENALNDDDIVINVLPGCNSFYITDKKELDDGE